MQDTRQADRHRRAAEELARSRAREALNAMLDRIGPRKAASDEACELVRLAVVAFGPNTAARRLTAKLWQFVAQ